MSELNRNACPNPVGMGVRMILGITVRIQIGTGVRLTSEYAMNEGVVEEGDPNGLLNDVG